MTPEEKSALKNRILDYRHGLARIDAEKANLKAIAAGVVAQGIREAHFKALALAYYHDTVQAVRSDLIDQVDLFDRVSDLD